MCDKNYRRFRRMTDEVKTSGGEGQSKQLTKYFRN